MIKQIEFIEHEFNVFKKAYPAMTFVEVRPTICGNTGKLRFPTHGDFMKTFS